MGVKNYMRFEFLSLPENLSFARSCVAAFATQLECTLEAIEEIKLVVSEAVSNSIIHAYEEEGNGKIEIYVSISEDNLLEIIVKDYGKGIADLNQALETNFSSKTGRMGLGFTFMKSFMDDMQVITAVDEGTSIILKRDFQIKSKEAYA